MKISYFRITIHEEKHWSNLKENEGILTKGKLLSTEHATGII
jgi:hypothetical protein